VSWDWQPIARIALALFAGLVILYELSMAKELDRPEPPSFTAHRYGIGALFLTVCYGFFAWWAGAFWPSWWKAILLAGAAYAIGFLIGRIKGSMVLRRAGLKERS